MQLDAVHKVLDHNGRFVTIDVEVGRTGEDGAQQVESRWTTLRHQLEHAEVAPPLIEDIGGRLHENTHLPGEQRRTIVATDDGVLLDDVHPLHAWWPETFEVGPLPDLSGWLRAEAAQLPFLLVRIDRIGADLELYRAITRPPTERSSTDGLSYYITKVSEGDWAQSQFQQTAEDRWRRNAEQVAEEVRSMLSRHRPAAVLVAGDVRARTDLVDALGEVHAEVIQIGSGGRSEGVSEEAMWAETEVCLAAVEAATERDLASRLAEGVSNRTGLVGLRDALDALVEQKVDTLMLDLAATAEMTVRPAEHPGLRLPESAQEEGELPADRVLVAAAALSGAEVALLPEPVKHTSHVAALLRWAGA